jgi:hypothetical protein
MQVMDARLHASFDTRLEWIRGETCLYIHRLCTTMYSAELLEALGRLSASAARKLQRHGAMSYGYERLVRNCLLDTEVLLCPYL